MDKKLSLKLNGGRQVVGILRGFDPFMNLVVDESVEECKDGSKNNVGMVVSKQETNNRHVILNEKCLFL